MVLPEEMAEIFSSMAGDYSQTCSKLEQLTLALFMGNGSYQTHIKKLRKLYSQKLAAVTDIFEKLASDFIEVRNTSSGINIILRINTEKSPAELKRDAESFGILCPHPKTALFSFTTITFLWRRSLISFRS